MAFFLKSREWLEGGIGHTASVHLNHVNCKTMLRWHVDNDDDRYVEATDCVNSNNVVVTSVDGFKAIVVVLSDLKSISDAIEIELRVLASQTKGEVKVR